MIAAACSLCVCVALGIIGPVMAAWEPGERRQVTERFDALKRTWSSVGVAFDLVLMRGSGVLLRLP